MLAKTPMHIQIAHRAIELLHDRAVNDRQLMTEQLMTDS
jgi:hypothetical protein